MVPRSFDNLGYPWGSMLTKSLSHRPGWEARLAQVVAVLWRLICRQLSPASLSVPTFGRTEENVSDSPLFTFPDIATCDTLVEIPTG